MAVQQPVWNLWRDRYFRLEIASWRHLPEEPSLLAGVPASREGVTSALAAGHDVIVWPGGEQDAMRNRRKLDPFGIALEILPTHIPLPAKIRTELLEPIRVDHDPSRARDHEYVDRVYGEGESAIQAGMDRLAARRRFPIFG